MTTLVTSHAITTVPTARQWHRIKSISVLAWRALHLDLLQSLGEWPHGRLPVSFKLLRELPLQLADASVLLLDLALLLFYALQQNRDEFVV